MKITTTLTPPNLTGRLVSMAGPRIKRSGAVELKNRIVALIRENILSGTEPGGVKMKPSGRFASAGTPLKFKERLAKSVSGATRFLRGQAPTIEIRATAEHATTHEYGATLRPVNAKNLAIPLSESVWSKLRRRSARDAFPNAFVIRLGPKGTGRLFLVQRPKGGGLEFLARLKKSVVIPPRPFFGLSQAQADTIAGVFGRILVQEFNEGR